MSPAKTAEPIEMPFELKTRLGPRNHVLDRGPDPHAKGQFLRERTFLTRDGTGSAIWPGRVGSRVSVSDPVFDPVLSFNMCV